jgi:hypothetical protein
MSAAISGVVHGRMIELDEPVPDLEGRRVRIVVELEDEASPSSVELSRAWSAWVAHGPDGPVADDGDPEIP